MFASPNLSREGLVVEFFQAVAVPGSGLLGELEAAWEYFGDVWSMRAISGALPCFQAAGENRCLMSSDGYLTCG